jgi:hypothetical protein
VWVGWGLKWLGTFVIVVERVVCQSGVLREEVSWSVACVGRVEVGRRWRGG